MSHFHRKPRENASKKIHKEIKELWKDASNRLGLEPIYHPKFGKFLDQHSKDVEIIASQHLQPWLAILEQAILWLVSLHIALTGDKGSKNQDLRVPWVLTGAACTEAIAVRKLCLCGLDLPARATLRSLIETLSVCTVTTYDKELRKRFMEPEDFDQTKNLWRQQFTKGKNIYKNN